MLLLTFDDTIGFKTINLKKLIRRDKKLEPRRRVRCQAGQEGNPPDPCRWF